MFQKKGKIGVNMNKSEPVITGITSDFDHEATCKYFLYRTLGSDDQQTVESGFKVRIREAFKKKPKIL